MEQNITDADCILSYMGWEEISSILQDAIIELLDNQPIPSPPPPEPAVLQLITQPEPVPAHSQVGGCSGVLPDTYIQAQFLPYQWPVYGIPMPAEAAVSHPAAPPPHTYNSVPVGRLPGGFDHNMQYVGMMNEEPLYAVTAGVFPPPAVPAAPQPSTSNSNKRNLESQQEDNQPYIKRPPNAFMLYMKEHRPHVEEGVKRMGNGAVNTVLGQRWKSLSAEEQAIYYQQAEREKLLHAQRHPGWSVSQNYGKKRKRDSRKAPKPASKRPCVSPLASTSQSAVMEARPTQTVLVPSQTDVVEPLQ